VLILAGAVVAIRGAARGFGAVVPSVVSTE
jgi:hypothetical protein